MLVEAATTTAVADAERPLPAGHLRDPTDKTPEFRHGVGAGHTQAGSLDLSGLATDRTDAGVTSDLLPLPTRTKPCRAAVLAGSLALFLLTSSSAAYAKKPTPTPTAPTTGAAAGATPDLAITFTGPAEGTAGTSAEWTLTVRNHGTAASSTFSVLTRLPQGMFVAGARPAAGWACVLGDTATPEGGLMPISDLSCTFEGGLPAEASAPSIGVTLRYGQELVGPQQVAAEVTQAQGEPDDALADNRSTQTTTLAAAPTPSSTPTVSVSGPHAPVLRPQATPTLPATGPDSGEPPAQLPFTGAGTTAGIILSAASILLGAALTRLGRRRYVPRHA